MRREHHLVAVVVMHWHDMGQMHLPRRVGSQGSGNDTDIHLLELTPPPPTSDMVMGGMPGAEVAWLSIRGVAGCVTHTLRGPPRFLLWSPSRWVVT